MTGGGTDRSALEAERSALTEDLQEVSRQRFMAKTIGDIEYQAVRGPLAERIEEIDDLLLAASSDDLVFDGPKLTLGSWWEEASPEAQRAALAAVIERIVVRSQREVIGELRAKADATPIKWRYRTDKAEVTLRRQVQIEWVPPYEGSGDEFTNEDEAVMDELERTTMRRAEPKGRRSSRNRA